MAHLVFLLMYLLLSNLWRHFELYHFVVNFSLFFELPTGRPKPDVFKSPGVTPRVLRSNGPLGGLCSKYSCPWVGEPWGRWSAKNQSQKSLSSPEMTGSTWRTGAIIASINAVIIPFIPGKGPTWCTCVGELLLVTHSVGWVASNQELFNSCMFKIGSTGIMDLPTRIVDVYGKCIPYIDPTAGQVNTCHVTLYYIIIVWNAFGGFWFHGLVKLSFWCNIYSYVVHLLFPPATWVDHRIHKWTTGHLRNSSFISFNLFGWEMLVFLICHHKNFVKGDTLRD